MNASHNGLETFQALRIHDPKSQGCGHRPQDLVHPSPHPGNQLDTRRNLGRGIRYGSPIGSQIGRKDDLRIARSKLNDLSNQGLGRGQGQSDGSPNGSNQADLRIMQPNRNQINRNQMNRNRKSSQINKSNQVQRFEGRRHEAPKENGIFLSSGDGRTGQGLRFDSDPYRNRGKQRQHQLQQQYRQGRRWSGGSASPSVSSLSPFTTSSSSSSSASSARNSPLKQSSSSSSCSPSFSSLHSSSDEAARPKLYWEKFSLDFDDRHVVETDEHAFVCLDPISPEFCFQNRPFQTPIQNLFQDHFQFRDGVEDSALPLHLSLGNLHI